MSEENGRFIYSIYHVLNKEYVGVVLKLTLGYDNISHAAPKFSMQSWLGG